jgi:hypothetical protein
VQFLLQQYLIESILLALKNVHTCLQNFASPQRKSFYAKKPTKIELDMYINLFQKIDLTVKNYFHTITCVSPRTIHTYFKIMFSTFWSICCEPFIPVYIPTYMYLRSTRIFIFITNKLNLQTCLWAQSVKCLAASCSLL